MVNISSVHWDDFNANWRTPLVHVQYHILVFVTNGKLQYSLNGHTVFPERSDLLYIPAGTLRAGDNAPDQLHQKYAVIFQPDDALPQQLPFLLNQGNQIIHTNSFEYLKQRFSSLYQHWVEKQPYSEMITKGIFMEILGYAQREASTKHIPPHKIKLVRHLKEYMLQHYRTPIKVGELARLVERSPNYVIAMFKEITGQTPLEFMLHLRISKAQELLLQTRMTHGEIAEYLGFYDSSYFHRIFKRLAGCSPSALRNPGSFEMQNGAVLHLQSGGNNGNPSAISDISQSNPKPAAP
ncbi:MAG: transcriptional regulator, AraC family [Paenibacillus sp.]|nr:transcriptional regulator, AraC family [Paenibacillus sp.]